MLGMLKRVNTFTCSYCGKFTLYNERKLTDHNGKTIGRLCKPCSAEEDAAWDSFRKQQDIEAEIEAILDQFCGHYGCWTTIDPYWGEECPMHVASTIDRDSDPEDEYVSINEVYSRALTTFGGNAELAREATEMYPGDFM